MSIQKLRRFSNQLIMSNMEYRCNIHMIYIGYNKQYIWDIYGIYIGVYIHDREEVHIHGEDIFLVCSVK